MAAVTEGWVLRIRDREPNPPQGLIGVQHLIRPVLEALPEAQSSSAWKVRRGAWGWGASICALEDDLVEQQSLAIDIGLLLEALDTGEYFNHVELELEEFEVSVAVVDSTYLQLLASRDLVEQCRAHFKDVEVLPPIQP